MNLVKTINERETCLRKYLGDNVFNQKERLFLFLFVKSVRS